jgi:hypothetical protein
LRKRVVLTLKNNFTLYSPIYDAVVLLWLYYFTNGWHVGLHEVRHVAFPTLAIYRLYRLYDKECCTWNLCHQTIKLSFFIALFWLGVKIACCLNKISIFSIYSFSFSLFRINSRVFYYFSISFIQQILTIFLPIQEILIWIEFNIEGM